MSILLLSGTAQAIELSKGELFWLTQNIYWESRDQPESGQIKVAIVTINRMKESSWPMSIKGVVTQPDQFSWYWDGKSDIPKNKKAWKECKKVAEVIANVWQYLSPQYKRIFWFHRYDVDWAYKEYYVVLELAGDHIFYVPKGANIHPKT